MNYTVTVVFHTYTGTTHIVAGHRAAVEHLLGDKLLGEFPDMRIDGHGTLCMPIKPRSMHSLCVQFDLSAKRLNEALEIDRAMCEPIDDREEWQKQFDEKYAEIEAELDHRPGFSWMNKP